MSDERSALPGSSLKLSHIAAGVVVLFVLLLTGWSAYQRYSVQQSIKDVDSQISETNTALDEMRAKQVESIIVAAQTVDQVQARAITWSEVITQLLEITPVDIFYRSYSASNEGEMTVSVLATSYESAAQLISILDGEPTFSNPFVASLTQGFTDSGTGVVSFGVTFNVQ